MKQINTKEIREDFENCIKECKEVTARMEEISDQREELLKEYFGLGNKLEGLRHHMKWQVETLIGKFFVSNSRDKTIVFFYRDNKKSPVMKVHLSDDGGAYWGEREATQDDLHKFLVKDYYSETDNAKVRERAIRIIGRVSEKYENKIRRL